MEIRAYRASDAGDTAELFYHTVHRVNCKDYSPTQLDAWAPRERDLIQWDCSFQGHMSLVAVAGNVLLGFGDITPAGYLDRLFVHKDHQGQGIGTALCSCLEAMVQGPVTAHVSLTARPFFEKRGYHLVRTQQVERRGVFLSNCVMEKTDGKAEGPGGMERKNREL